MKKCCMCKIELSFDKFKKNCKRKDGLQSQCIECQKEYRRNHYNKNRKKYIDKAGYWKKIFLQWWKEYKKQFYCLKCGENHPACIDFHHINDNKENSVSQLVGLCNKEKVLKEIEKCIPLCSNCHRKEHWSINNSI